MKLELTELDSSIILSALNEQWNRAFLELERGYVIMQDGSKRPLGDIERALNESTVQLTTPLIKKFENL